MQPEFLAVGDITTDAFIRIKDAAVHCDLNRENCELCVRFGDKIPYESVTIIPAVGNAPNAAVAAARLGLPTGLIADLGKDAIGTESIEKLAKEGISTNFVRLHEGIESNYHYVLWYEEERTILVKHHDYPYKLPEIGAPKWLYLSSLGEASLPYHEEIAACLAAHPEVKLAFQPGTFQMKLGKEKLQAIYARAELLSCNKDEARLILGTKEENIGKLLEGLAALGPKIVCITDGPSGAYAFDGSQKLRVPMYPDPKPPFERTGAGDAFASTVAAALALGKPLAEALLWGPINSMAVVQKVGAQEGLLTRQELEAWLAKAPEDYKVEILA